MNLGSTGRLLAMTGCAAALFLLPACNEADPIAPSSGSVAISVQPSTAGTGRYESATLALIRARVRRVDELGNTLLAFSPIQLSATRIPTNLAPGSATFTVASALPAGRYQMDQLGIEPPQLVDSTVPLPAPTSCIEKLASVPQTTGAQIPPIDYFAFQLTDPVWTFDIGPGSQQLVFTVNAPALVQLVESSFTCDDSSGTAVLTSFNTTAYQNGLLPLLGVHK